MPKVEMIARLSGARDGSDWPEPGQTIDVPGEEASDLVRLGLARFIDKSPEKAVAKEPETASRKGAGLTKANTGL